MTTISYPHEHIKLAVAPHLAEGREWFIGKLKEPILEYPGETHCLHMKTPEKDITFLCNEADFQNMIEICFAVTGEINQSWLDIQIAHSRKLASNE